VPRVRLMESPSAYRRLNDAQSAEGLSPTIGEGPRVSRLCSPSLTRLCSRSLARARSGSLGLGPQAGRAAGPQAGRAAGWQGRRAAGWQGRRAAGWQGRRAAGWQGRRAAGWQGRRAAKNNLHGPIALRNGRAYIGGAGQWPCPRHARGPRGNRQQWRLP
jgi:hypothetical protein